MTGVERIAAERRRQIDVEGWSPKHDAEHGPGELAAAAAAYATGPNSSPPGEAWPPPGWPWEPKWWKPSADPIRNLEKAGALIAAEIDRLLAIRGRQGICEHGVHAIAWTGGSNPALYKNTCTACAAHGSDDA